MEDQNWEKKARERESKRMKKKHIIFYAVYRQSGIKYQQIDMKYRQIASKKSSNYRMEWLSSHRVLETNFAWIKKNDAGFCAMAFFLRHWDEFIVGMSPFKQFCTRSMFAIAYFAILCGIVDFNYDIEMQSELS